MPQLKEEAKCGGSGHAFFAPARDLLDDRHKARLALGQLGTARLGQLIS